MFHYFWTCFRSSVSVLVVSSEFSFVVSSEVICLCSSVSAFIVSSMPSFVVSSKVISADLSISFVPDKSLFPSILSTSCCSFSGVTSSKNSLTSVIVPVVEVLSGDEKFWNFYQMCNVCLNFKKILTSDTSATVTCSSDLQDNLSTSSPILPFIKFFASSKILIGPPLLSIYQMVLFWFAFHAVLWYITSSTAMSG